MFPLRNDPMALAGSLNAARVPVLPKKPGLLDQIFGMGGQDTGLFGQDVTKRAGQMGLLNAGLTMLAAGGRQPNRTMYGPRPNLGQALLQSLQAGQQGYQQVLGGASDLGAMREKQDTVKAEQAREAARQAIIAKYAGRYDDPKAIASMQAELAAVTGKFDGALAATGGYLAAMQPKPEEAKPFKEVDRGDFIDITNPITGEVIRTIKKGVDPAVRAQIAAANARAAAGGNGGQPTMAERQNAGLGMLIETGVARIDKMLEDGGASLVGGVAQQVPGVGRFFMTKEQQLYNDTVDQIASGAQYLLSGKAVTETERKVIRNLYGYKPGDTEETLKLKRQRMGELVQMARMMAGRAAGNLGQATGVPSGDALSRAAEDPEYRQYLIETGQLPRE